VDIKETIKLLKDGNHVCYKQWHGSGDEKWFRHYPTDRELNGGMDRSANHIAIYRKDEAIADAVIANPDVKVEYKHYFEDEIEYDWRKADNFIQMYNKNADYRLLPKLNDETVFSDHPQNAPQTNSIEDLNELPLSSEGDHEKELQDKFLDIDERDLPGVFRVTEVESDFAHKVYGITNALAEMLIDKNKKYGNSALEPKRIFSNADPIEQIKVRIDDKLSRMSNQKEEDEDVVQDLLGYLVLLKIAKGKNVSKS